MGTFTKEGGAAGFTVQLQNGHIFITRIGATKSDRTYRNVEEGTWEKMHDTMMKILAESTRAAIADKKLQEAKAEFAHATDEELVTDINTDTSKNPLFYDDISNVLNGGHSEDGITDEELREEYGQYE